MKKMTKQDWDDAADLFEQGGVMAEMSTETHTKAACVYVRTELTKLALKAQATADDL
jgi:hypothetical protein